MKIPVTRLCSAAGIGRTTYREALLGRPIMAATLAKLQLALKRIHIGFGGEAEGISPKAAFSGAMVIAANYMKADAYKALNSDPSRRATANPEWLRAAQVRKVGYWIANGCMGFRTSDIGRAAGVTKQAVSNAIADVETERDRDPDLDRICREIERVFG